MLPALGRQSASCSCVIPNKDASMFNHEFTSRKCMHVEAMTRDQGSMGYEVYCIRNLARELATAVQDVLQRKEFERATTFYSSGSCKS